MRVRLTATLATPDGTLGPGAFVDLPDDQARHLILNHGGEPAPAAGAEAAVVQPAESGESPYVKGRRLR